MPFKKYKSFSFLYQNISKTWALNRTGVLGVVSYNVMVLKPDSIVFVSGQQACGSVKFRLTLTKAFQT